MAPYVASYTVASCFRCYRQIQLTPPGATEPGGVSGIMRWLPQGQGQRGDCPERAGEHCTPFPPE